MVKRKQNGSRNAYDNPLAAARSGKSTTKELPTEKSNVTKNGAVDWIDFGTTGNKHEKKVDKQASKTSAKAEQIWHRRSGAGFHLFVDYYLGQPDGIVTVSGTDNDKVPFAGPSQTSSQTNSSLPTGGAGQSRAALRRKKKKRRKLVDNDNNTASNEQQDTQPETTTTNHTMPAANCFSHDQLLYSGHLLNVFSSKTETSSTASFRDFLTALSKPLPLTFRFRRYDIENTSHHRQMVPSHDQRRQRIQKIKGLRQILKGKTLAASNVRPVPFDPDYIYQAMAPPQNNSHHPFPIDKISLKRTCPQLKEFLNEHTGNGTIARQELGSMLPVWLLDRVGAFSSMDVPLRVLDTCASPGSKTLQVAEIVSTTKGGRVRANDVNANRLESLKEALERSGFFGDDSDSEDEGASSMNSLLRFSNVDASRFPIPKTEGKKYPIILCDVPCSGDGTVRKDVHVIPNWTPSISNALHSLQVKILVRALRCVALNGFVSYSTCSLNPIEDEAVVRAALEIEQKDGKFGFELVQVSNTQLNGLILRKGVFTWRVADFHSELSSNKTRMMDETDRKDDEGDGLRNDETDDEHDEKPAQLQWYDSYDKATEGGMTDALASMWPPNVDKACSSSSALPPLDRCLRLLPQDQDTGGFFVALIRRIE